MPEFDVAINHATVVLPGGPVQANLGIRRERNGSIASGAV